MRSFSLAVAWLTVLGSVPWASGLQDGQGGLQVPAHDEADAHALRGRILRQSHRRAHTFGKPVWHITSSAGEATYACGAMLSASQLGPCSQSRLDHFERLSPLLAELLRNSSKVFSEVVMLGQADPGHLKSCTAVVPAGSMLESNRTRRLVFDTRYWNFPRCCDHHLDAQGLDTTPAGEMTEWTESALRKLDMGKFTGMPYYTLAPPLGVCSTALPCPFVVELSGSGGMPWLLVQAHCETCHKELGAHMLAITKFTSVDQFFVNTHFIPLVKSFLGQKDYLDKERTYLVSASLGNEVAFYAALANPHLFSVVALAGAFRINDDIKELMAQQRMMREIQGTRLSSIQFHIGDNDQLHADGEFFGHLHDALRKFPTDGPQVELRLYLESEHPVWYASWNALHEVIWTGSRNRTDLNGNLLTTCVSEQQG